LSVGDSAIDRVPPEGDADRYAGDGSSRSRQEWVRENFSQIFGTSAADLAAQGIDPRQYAREHRDQIRRFAQLQRQRGIAVPSGNGRGAGGPAGNGPAGRRYGYSRGGPYGTGFRGGAWIGILLALFALRFLLVDTFAGAHAAIFWVLGIGGILLVARVFLFSWLRRRRRDRWQ
jgi:hypothetical protein